MSRSYALLAVGAAGLLLHFVSPFAASAITGVAVVAAFFVTMKFSTLATRTIQRTLVLLHGIAVYLMSGSIPFALGALFAAASLWLAGEIMIKTIRGSGLIAWRVLLAVAAVVCFAIAWPIGWSGLAVLPVLGVMMMCLYFSVTMLGEFTRKPQPKLRVGEPAPDFALPRRSGDGEFRLEAERGKSVLVCFVRADWCPVCQVLMRIYRKAAPALAEHGVKLVLINPSSGEEAKSFAEDMGLDYEIAVDVDLGLAKRLGLLTAHKPTKSVYALPISFLVDPSGVVRFIFGVEDVSHLTPEKISGLLKQSAAAPAGA